MNKLGYSCKELDRWCSDGFGASLLELECAQLSGLLSKIHGDYLMQIGGPSSMPHCAASAIPYRFRVSAESMVGNEAAYVQADLVDLPVMPDGIDLVMLPHVLEFSDDPEALLQEIYQALAPGGQLILLGFNPYSLLGLSKCFGARHDFPWQGRLWSRSRVKHWLRKLGYSIIVNKTLCFRWPISQYRAYALTDFSEVLAQLCCPGCGDIYFITAQKKTYSPLFQKADWWGKRVSEGNRIIEPTTRV